MVSYEEHAFLNTVIEDVGLSLHSNGVEMIGFFKVQANPLLSHIHEAVDICKVIKAR